MLYLNGDNDLYHEVLYAVDMLETVGSTEDINILALVDGRRGSAHGYGRIWEGTRLLYITHDDRIGQINSLVLQEMGEQNMGSAATLESFVRKCREYPAQKYIFGTFAHGRGIIDTKTLTQPGRHKSLAISVDDTDKSRMSLPDFRTAVQRGLNGEKFDLMILFSCLSNMVEVSYALKDVTNYLIASEDEIRIVNSPPGEFQIRGIKFEEPLRAMQGNPALTIGEYGNITIDTFIEQYARDVNLQDKNGRSLACRYAASMALVDCRALDDLANQLDQLAVQIKAGLTAEDQAADLIRAIRTTFTETQRYSSFMNLEYYDLQGFLRNLAQKTSDRELKRSCLDVVKFVRDGVIVYEQHTPDSLSFGISIYLSNPLIPENVFQAHQAMYRKSLFSRNTSWDEMIEVIRKRMVYGCN